MEFLEPYEILLKKAEGDIRLVELMRKSQDYTLDFEIYMFHLQQAAEKSLKAILIKMKITYSRTHDLEVLIEKCYSNNIELNIDEMKINDLTDYAVEGRYDFLSDIEDYDYYNEVRKLYEIAKNIVKIKKDETTN